MVRGEGKNWGGLEPGGDVLKTSKTIKTHANQWYLQTACDLRRCSWCFEQIFEEGECFLLQIKCMMSASVEFIFYWARLIISVWDNEPKLKETTVNYLALRHHWSIEEYTLEHSESVKRYARIAWASLISSLKEKIWLLAPPFFPDVSTSSVWGRKLKRKVIFNSCLNLYFF